MAPLPMRHSPRTLADCPPTSTAAPGSECEPMAHAAFATRSGRLPARFGDGPARQDACGARARPQTACRLWPGAGSPGPRRSSAWWPRARSSGSVRVLDWGALTRSPMPHAPRGLGRARPASRRTQPTPARRIASRARSPGPGQPPACSTGRARPAPIPNVARSAAVWGARGRPPYTCPRSLPVGHGLRLRHDQMLGPVQQLTLQSAQKGRAPRAGDAVGSGGKGRRRVAAAGRRSPVRSRPYGRMRREGSQARR